MFYWRFYQNYVESDIDSAEVIRSKIFNRFIVNSKIWVNFNGLFSWHTAVEIICGQEIVGLKMLISYFGGLCWRWPIKVQMTLFYIIFFVIGSLAQIFVVNQKSFWHTPQGCVWLKLGIWIKSFVFFSEIAKLLVPKQCMNTEIIYILQWASSFTLQLHVF